MPPREVEVLPLGAVTEAMGALLSPVLPQGLGRVMALPSAPLLPQLRPLSSPVFPLAKQVVGFVFSPF